MGLISTLLLLLISSLPSTHGNPDHHLLSLAFRSVSNFQLPEYRTGEIRDITLPSRNLIGTVAWMFLRNISTLRSIDLSNNALDGSIPGAFWSSLSFSHVNLSNNRFGGAVRFSPGSGRALRVLDLSRNRFTSAFGLDRLRRLRVLDVSKNNITAIFPNDFPPVSSLQVLNLSFNNLTGSVGPTVLKKFGSSAFQDAGSLALSPPPPPPHPPHPPHPPSTNRDRKMWHRKQVVCYAILSTISAALVVFGLLCLLFMRRRKKKKDEIGNEAAAAEEEATWVAEARWSAPVIVLEKPLLELTFSDLVAATSGFARESQLTEGPRSGPLYRAVLPGDLHVVVRVLQSTRAIGEREAEAAFRQLARLRHPNLLPLLGYCIAGKEKLLLYEYMQCGDMHRWLHELPAEWSGEDDTWEHNKREAPLGTCDWPSRHRVALGVARGLAYLHQGWAGSGRPLAHGHLVPSNILLDDNMEARIADCWSGPLGVEVGSAQEDVYSFGLLLLELVTGRARWSEAEVGWARRLLRDGRAAEVADSRLRAGDEPPEWEKEMVECLRVGYLCTAQVVDKRPTMQQVVGLLKDVRPATVGSIAASTSSESLGRTLG